MSFFAVLLALVLEQLRPMPRDSLVQNAVRAWVDAVGRNFDAGRSHHAWLVWGLSVLLPTAAMAALLPDHRRAMEMFHVDGLPYREIAAKLGVPMGTVCTWISRGRRSIADALGDEGKFA